MKEILISEDDCLLGAAAESGSKDTFHAVWRALEAEPKITEDEVRERIPRRVIYPEAITPPTHQQVVCPSLAFV